MTKELDEFELAKTEARAVTGVLASHPNSTDVHISSLSLTFHGQELLADTSLELNSGRRYGLIGLNGTGKWSLIVCEVRTLSRDVRGTAMVSEIFQWDAVVVEIKYHLAAFTYNGYFYNYLLAFFDVLLVMANQLSSRSGQSGYNFRKCQ